MTPADSPQWILAKAAGDHAELAVAEWFRGRGWEPFRTIARADYDLLLQCAVEVKHDRQAATTGNVAIEIAYRNQPSGIVTSTAAWWAIVVGQQALLVKSDRLRSFVLSNDFRETRAGDNGASLIRLVPLDRLLGLPGCHVIKLSSS
ncbi:MAG TPA: hypothetical protein VGG64_07725 [Pirellulales bacterium]|jgi:hypothetical protein